MRRVRWGLTVVAVVALVAAGGWFGSRRALDGRGATPTALRDGSDRRDTSSAGASNNPSVATALSTASAPEPAAAAAAGTPAPTGAVRVTVRDFAGVPVGGLRVVARPSRIAERPTFAGMRDGTALDAWRELPPSWDLAPRAEARTSDDGSAALSRLAPGPWTVAVESAGRVGRAAPCVVTSNGRADVELRTEPGHPLEGRVLTERGTPVADAFVLAEYPGIAPGGRCVDVPADFVATRSDAEGRYRFDALPAALVTVQCGPPGTWSSHAWRVHVPSVAKLDLQMTTRGPVEGWVGAEPGGAPVAGADVVFSVETWHTARTTAHATTGADGRYSIPVYPGEGVMSISVAAAGFRPVPRMKGARQPPFRLYEDRPTVLNLGLVPDTDAYADARGVVRGPDGPVAGASVYVSASSDDGYWSQSAKSDAAGRFRIFGLPARRAQVIVGNTPGLFQPGGDRDDDASGPDLRLWIEPDAPRPVELEVVLARGGKVAGRVVDEEGRPVAGAEVRTRGGVQSTSAADGTFLLEGLDEPAEAKVVARHEAAGLEGTSAKFTAGVGADVTGIEVRVAPRQRASRHHRIVVTGRVHLADAAASMRDGYVACDGAWTPIGADGAFRAEADVYAGWRELPCVVAVPGWGERAIKLPIPLGAGATAPGTDAVVDAGDLEIQRAGAISGEVVGPDGPLAGVVIGLERASDFRGIACGFDDDPEPPILAITDADGAFHATCVAPGTYTLHAGAPGHFENDETISVAGDGDATQCSIRLVREAFLRGRVRRDDGRTVVGASIQATESAGGDDSREQWRRRSEYGRVGSDGEFTVRVRADRSYIVEVSPGRDGDEAGVGDAFRITQSGPHAPSDGTIEIVVTDGARIAGRVVDAAGDPVAGAAVCCRKKSGEYDGAHEARTADDGTFAVTALGEGPYDLTIAAGLADTVVVADVEPGADAAQFQIPVATVIEGVLVGEDGQPVAERTVIASPIAWPRGDRSLRIQSATDAVGRFRLVGAGAGLCRIELASGDRHDRIFQSTAPLVGGVGVAPGAKDVVVRIPPKAATTIACRVVDDAGEPFADFTLYVPTSESSTSLWSGHGGPTELEFDGLRLDEPCAIVAEFAGLRWMLDIPVGTLDLVLTAGLDGLHKVEFGGRAHAKFPVEVRVRGPGDGGDSPRNVRLVHSATGAIVVPRVDRSQLHRFPDLPVGPYRLEGTDDPDAGWTPCRPSADIDGAFFVWDE